jgi:predicted MFS family arabinose efflux permease
MDDPLVRDGLVLLVVVLSALGAYLVHRFAPPALRENNEFTGFTFSFVGLVYGVYLAFTVVIVFALVDPHSGDVSVKPDAFRSVLESFAARRAEAPQPLR